MDIKTVDRLINVRQAALLKSGGVGIRYTCKIMGKQVYYDEGKSLFNGKWSLRRYKA